MLSADSMTALDSECMHAVATDDVMIFSAAGPGVTTLAAEKVDSAMHRAGMVRHEDKVVSDSLDAMCIGVQLEQGTRWAAPAGRCLSMLLKVLSLVDSVFASAYQVHQCLGTMQWYDLLARPKLSVYRAVYKFVESKACKRLQKVPAEVAAELLLGSILGVFWAADMQRPLQPLVCCSDDSTSVGFGGAVLHTSLEVARELAKIACKRDVRVLLDDGERPSTAMVTVWVTVGEFVLGDVAEEGAVLNRVEAAAA